MAMLLYVGTQNRTVSKNIEDVIKLYTKHQKINSTYNETKVIEVSNIDNVIRVIDSYADK